MEQLIISFIVMNSNITLNSIPTLPTKIPSMSTNSTQADLVYDYHFLTRTVILAGTKTVYLLIIILTMAGLVLVSTVGNSLAIHTLLGERMRQRRISTLFLHLALADCMVTVWSMAGQTFHNFHTFGIVRLYGYGLVHARSDIP